MSRGKGIKLFPFFYIITWEEYLFEVASLGMLSTPEYWLIL